jgi:hypothetical protein
MYPDNDTQFTTNTITKVEGTPEKGYALTMDDGWSIWTSSPCTVVPKVGDELRLYGKGLGFAVRGMFIAGQLVYYRTEDEDRTFHNEQMYGKDAAEWLRRWDAGQSVWSITMGGFGPGYEQAIQITVAEVLRKLLEMQFTFDVPEDKVKAQWEIVEAWSPEHPKIKEMSLSGAQWGAACNLAALLYRRGPIGVMTDARVKDRHIQVSKNFPRG